MEHGTRSDAKSWRTIDQLSSQGFQIIQSSKVFAFSLDAVLLAAFVRPTQAALLEVGGLCAGNGAVGLFKPALCRAGGGSRTQQRLADMADRLIQSMTHGPLPSN